MDLAASTFHIHVGGNVMVPLKHVTRGSGSYISSLIIAN